MSYTKIPATNIGSALGSAIGSAAGSVASLVNKSLDLIEVRVKTLQQQADELQSEVRTIQDSAEEQILIESSKTSTPSNGGGAYARFLVATGASEGIPTLVQDLDSYRKRLLQETELIVKQRVRAFNLTTQTEVATINATLEAATVALTAILKVLGTLEKVAKLLQVPLPALKAIIPVIKLLPLPLRYLISSFIILESDLLEMTEQLISQTLDEISSISNIISVLKQLLQPILDRIERIRASVALVNMEQILMDISVPDKDVLDKAGLLDSDTNESLLSKIQNGLLSGNSTSCFGLRNKPDLSQPELGNKLQLSKPGDVVSLDIHPSGSYIESWFCVSENEPEIPVGFPRESGSWSREVPVSTEKDRCWKIDLKVTGTGIIFNRLDSKPEVVENPVKNLPDLGKEEYLVLGYDNFSKKPGILKIDNWLKLLETALNSLRNLPLSQELKDRLSNFWNVQVASARGEDVEDQVNLADKFHWMSPSGELYTLVVVEDDHSPRVAVRRFVQVVNSQGVVVLEGLKTFSTNTDTLLEEIKLQLNQLIQ